MAITFRALTRPTAGAEPATPSWHRRVGLVLAAAGLALATISLIAGVVAGDLARQGATADQVGALGAWSFGLATAAFGTVKLAIGLVLLGIVRHIWMRVESVKAALPKLMRAGNESSSASGSIEATFGSVGATATAPRPPLIHRLAALMWAPMLAMGVMLVYAGLLLSFAVAGNVGTAELFNYAFAAYQLSTGRFDVSSGVLRQVWDFSSGRLPSQAAIADILPRIGLSKVGWVAPQLDFLQAGMELDFGGIGKEYAVDRAAEVCRAAGIQSGLLDFGGDIRVLGPHPDGSPWHIGIRHPRNPDLSLGNLQLMSGAVATSGDYERYLEVAGKRYCHILNPLTGWPVHGLYSVTVTADQCLLAGTLATIAMLKEEGGKQWLAELGAQHCWVDGELRVGGNIQLL